MNYIDIEKELLKNIKDFISQTGMSRSAFGKKACGDPKVVMRLEEGRGIMSKNINSIRRYLASPTRRRPE